MFSLKYMIAVFVIFLGAGTLMAEDLTPEKFATMSANQQQDWLKKIQENYVAKEAIQENYVPKENYEALKGDYELLASPDLADLEPKIRGKINKEIKFRRQNFDTMPYELYAFKDEDNCNIYWTDIPTTNRSGSCFTGVHLLAPFLFFAGMEDGRHAVQVCGFPMSSKPDVFKPPTLITKFSPINDETFRERCQ